MQGNKRLKIVYIVTKGVWGGAQKYVYSLATNLPKDRFEATVICGQGNILKQKWPTLNVGHFLCSRGLCMIKQ